MLAGLGAPLKPSVSPVAGGGFERCLRQGLLKVLFPSSAAIQPIRRYAICNPRGLGGHPHGMMGQIEVGEGGAPLFPHENMRRTYFYPYVTHAETGKEEPGAQSGGSRCPAQAGAIVHLGGPSKATWARGDMGVAEPLPGWFGRRRFQNPAEKLLRNFITTSNRPSALPP